MQVDDEFIRAVSNKLPRNEDDFDFTRVIAATLSVAAERGMLVPEGEEWLDAVQTESGNLLLRFSHYRPLPGEKLVRVAVVEIKE